MTTLTDRVPKPVMTRARKLDRLNERYQTAGDLQHLKYKQRFVPGGGSHVPAILFVGDCPGAQEAASGVPLVGRRFAFVSELLRGIDLKPQHVYVTHLLKWRTPAGRDPKPLERDAALPFLLDEIGVLQPRVVVTWGRYLLTTLAPSESMESVHGQRVKVPELTFVPMFSPDAGIVNPHVTRLLVDDFQKIRKLL
jgi:uracil-DNA glycosylase